jgi:hypothetical protein
MNRSAMTIQMGVSLALTCGGQKQIPGLRAADSNRLIRITVGLFRIDRTQSYGLPVNRYSNPYEQNVLYWLS